MPVLARWSVKIGDVGQIGVGGNSSWGPHDKADQRRACLATLASPVQVDGAMAGLTDLPLWVWWPGQVVTHRARSPRSYQWEFDGGITGLDITLAPTWPAPT